MEMFKLKIINNYKGIFYFLISLIWLGFIFNFFIFMLLNSFLLHNLFSIIYNLGLGEEFLWWDLFSLYIYIFNIFNIFYINFLIYYFFYIKFYFYINLIDFYWFSGCLNLIKLIFLNNFIKFSLVLFRLKFFLFLISYSFLIINFFINLFFIYFFFNNNLIVIDIDSDLLSLIRFLGLIILSFYFIQFKFLIFLSLNYLIIITNKLNIIWGNNVKVKKKGINWYYWAWYTSSKFSMSWNGAFFKQWVKFLILFWFYYVQFLLCSYI